MTYIPITNAEIAPGKPLKSDILARLRDNPAEKLCDPPGSQALKLRPSGFTVDAYYQMHYRDQAEILVGKTDAAGEISVIELQAWFNPNNSPSYNNAPQLSASCLMALAAIPIYSGGTCATVRFARRRPPVSITGSRSGTLETQAWVDVATNDTWVSVFTFTVSGQNPTLQVKAKVVGNQVIVAAKRLNAYSGRLYCCWNGYVHHLEYKSV